MSGSRQISIRLSPAATRWQITTPSASLKRRQGRTARGGGAGGGGGPSTGMFQLVWCGFKIGGSSSSSMPNIPARFHAEPLIVNGKIGPAPQGATRTNAETLPKTREDGRCYTSHTRHYPYDGEPL